MSYRHLYAWISEFGIAAPDAKSAASQLEARAREFQETPYEYEYSHRLMATFGDTDITEIACFSQINHFIAVAESTHRSSRKTIGARSLTDQELGSLYADETPTADPLPTTYSLRDLRKILEKSTTLPFLAIVYLRFSVAARLCVPPDDSPWKNAADRTLTDQFLQRFFAPTAPMWTHYRGVLKTTLGEERFSESSAQIHLAPLIGLDSVDIVLVFRARRLEQIASLTWAARHQKLGSVWHSDESVVAPRRDPFIASMFDLLGGDADAEHIQSDWNNSPLFKEVRTVWGMPIYENKVNRSTWQLEESGGGPPAAEAAVLFSAARVAPDRFWDSTEPMTALPESKEALQKPPGGKHSLMLFGGSDTLSLSSVRLQKLEVTDIRDRFQHITSLGSADAPGGIWPSTEVAVRIGVPYPDFQDVLPTYSLMRDFRSRIHKMRVNDFHLAVSWSRDWLICAKAAGYPYATTNALVNVIRSLMVYLERDPEGFSDLLSPILRILKIGREEYPTQQDVGWVVEKIRDQFVLLGRQYFPLQAPTVMQTLEANAGFEKPRDAFIAFAKTVAKGIAPHHQLLVMDSAYGGLTTELGPLGYIVFHVSPLIIHYPMTWLVVGPLVRSRLSQTPADRLFDPAAKEGLRNLCEYTGLSIRSEDSVEITLQRIGQSLRYMETDRFGRIFNEALVTVLREIVGDYVLFGSLRLKADSAEDTRRRFWLIYGQGLVSGTRSFFGETSPSIVSIQQLVLRIFFINQLVTLSTRQVDDASFATWTESMLAIFTQILEDKFGLSDYPETFGMDPVQRSYVHMQCMRLDLRIPEAKWLTAIGLLRSSLEDLHRSGHPIGAFVRDWLKSVHTVGENWLLRYFNESTVTNLYCGYLSDLIEDWTTSDPWPPFIERNQLPLESAGIPRPRVPKQGVFGGVCLLRGGIRIKTRQDAPEGQLDYLRKTGALMKRLEDCSRKIRREELHRFISGDL